MITTASNYAWSDVAGLSIAGKIVPAVAGTGEEPVIGMEDIAYLVEMARERGRWQWRYSIGFNLLTQKWDNGVGVSPPVDTYDPDIRVQDHRPLLQLSKIANELMTTNLSGRNSAPDMYPIPAGWSASTAGIAFPHIATNPWRAFNDSWVMPGAASSAGSWYVGTDLLDTPLIDTLRRIYYDLKQVKRFVTMPGGPPGFSDKDEYDFYDEIVNHGLYLGDPFLPVFSTAGSTTTLTRIEWDRTNNYSETRTVTTLDGFATPRCYIEFDSDQVPIVQEITTSPTHILLCWLKGRCFHPQTHTAVVPAGNPVVNGWASWLVTAKYWGGSNHDTLMDDYTYIVVPMKFDGRNSWTPSGNIRSIIDIGFDLDQSTTPIDPDAIWGYGYAWANRSVPGFATKPVSLGVTLSQIVVDTGPLNFNSEIDSLNWNWTP